MPVNFSSIRIKYFDDESKSLLLQAIKDSVESNQPVLPVSVDSYGGNAYIMLSMMDHLENAKSKYGLQIVTFTDSIAMSAGAGIFSTGQRRIISPNATIMFHDVIKAKFFTVQKGKEIEAEGEELKNTRNKYLSAIERNIGKPPGYLEDMLKEKFNADYMVHAPEALEMGFATEIGIPSLQDIFGNFFDYENEESESKLFTNSKSKSFLINKPKGNYNNSLEENNNMSLSNDDIKSIVQAVVSVQSTLQAENAANLNNLAGTLKPVQSLPVALDSVESPEAKAIREENEKLKKDLVNLNKAISEEKKSEVKKRWLGHAIAPAAEASMNEFLEIAYTSENPVKIINAVNSMLNARPDGVLTKNNSPTASSPAISSAPEANSVKPDLSNSLFTEISTSEENTYKLKAPGEKKEYGIFDVLERMNKDIPDESKKLRFDSTESFNKVNSKYESLLSSGKLAEYIES